MLNNIYQAIMQFLFPSHCPSCNAYVEQKGMWCPSCLEEIIRNENLAYDEDIRQYISPIIAIGKYDKGLKNLIHELKYQNKFATLAYLKPLFSYLDEDWDFSTYDMIIPVPLHKNKLKKRGFNQDYVDVKNRKCLLIDDIFTTGSTLKNCAMVLKNHGAKTVSGLVLASQANITLPTKPSKEVFF